MGYLPIPVAGIAAMNSAGFARCGESGATPARQHSTLDYPSTSVR
jgi:hypothetical protein